VTQQKVDYSELKEGYEFPQASFCLDSSLVNAYIKAVNETSALYQKTRFAPPMAVAALAMAALSEGVSFPSGAIHVSQEVEFLDTVNINDVIVSHSRVSRKQKRGPVNLMAIEFHVFNENDKEVLKGKTEFILPEPAVSDKQ
jgi:acyl dehydratase